MTQRSELITLNLEMEIKADLASVLGSLYCVVEDKCVPICTLIICTKYGND